MARGGSADVCASCIGPSDLHSGKSGGDVFASSSVGGSCIGVAPSGTSGAGGKVGIVASGAGNELFPAAAAMQLSTIAFGCSGCGTGVDGVDTGSDVDDGAASEAVGG